MKVIIAGGTGFIGSHLVQLLVEGGHEVTVLIRSAKDPPEIFPKSVRLAPYSDMPDAADAVINLAGESVVGRWTKDKMARILDSRVDITRALVKWMASLQTPPTVFLSCSAVGFYGDRGETRLTEESAPDPERRFRCLVCIAWEAEANEAKKAGIRVVNLRIGNVMDPSGGILDQLGAKFKYAPFIVPHARSLPMSWISLTDALGIIRFALENDSVSGPVNVVAPDSATWEQFYDGLGMIKKKKVVGQIPKWVLRLAVGKMAVAILDGQIIAPEKIEREGYVFQHRELTEYLSGLKNG